jgi:hypothetical protein
LPVAQESTSMAKSIPAASVSFVISDLLLKK